MKYCPVCKTDYSDNAQFCKKCEAYLLEKTAAPANVKTDFRRLAKLCLYTAGFIVFIMLLYQLFALFLK